MGDSLSAVRERSPPTPAARGGARLCGPASVAGGGSRRRDRRRDLGGAHPLGSGTAGGDRSRVLRMGTAEVLYEPEVPTRVILDEAIEIAKRFGSGESGRFVNGVLDRIARDHRPGGRLRTAFISDIHANLEALEVVLEDLRDRTWIASTAWATSWATAPTPTSAWRGCRRPVPHGHRQPRLGRAGADGHHRLQRVRARRRGLDRDAWTKSRAYLAALPLTHDSTGSASFTRARWSPRGGPTCCPSGGRTPVQGLLGTTLLHRSFPSSGGDRGAAAGRTRRRDYPEEGPLPLLAEARYIINVGSVGQPRDRDPRGAYVVHDAEADTVLLRRLEYPVPVVQAKILASGLPRFSPRLDSESRRGSPKGSRRRRRVHHPPQEQDAPRHVVLDQEQERVVGGEGRGALVRKRWPWPPRPRCPPRSPGRTPCGPRVCTKSCPRRRSRRSPPPG